jgi:hypothetical protein
MRWRNYTLALLLQLCFLALLMNGAISIEHSGIHVISNAIDAFNTKALDLSGLRPDYPYARDRNSSPPHHLRHGIEQPELRNLTPPRATSPPPAAVP